MLEEEGEVVNTRTVSLSLVTRLMEPYTVSVKRLVTSLDMLGLLEASDFLIRGKVAETGSGLATDGDMIVSAVLRDPDGVTDTDPGMMAELSLTLVSRSGNKESG